MMTTVLSLFQRATKKFTLEHPDTFGMFSVSSNTQQHGQWLRVDETVIDGSYMENLIYSVSMLSSL